MGVKEEGVRPKGHRGRGTSPKRTGCPRRSWCSGIQTSPSGEKHRTRKTSQKQQKLAKARGDQVAAEGKPFLQRLCGPAPLEARVAKARGAGAEDHPQEG